MWQFWGYCCTLLYAILIPCLKSVLPIHLSVREGHGNSLRVQSSQTSPCFIWRYRALWRLLKLCFLSFHRLITAKCFSSLQRLVIHFKNGNVVVQQHIGRRRANYKLPGPKRICITLNDFFTHINSASNMLHNMNTTISVTVYVIWMESTVHLWALLMSTLQIQTELNVSVNFWFQCND